MIWRRTLNRLLRRGPDASAVDELLMRLSQYSIEATPVSEDDFRAMRERGLVGRGTRLIAAVALHEPRMSYALLTRVVGEGAAHSGQMRAVGAHLLVDRVTLPSQWSAEWRTPLAAMPTSSERELGAIRSVQWRPRDATDATAQTLAQELSRNDRVQRRVLGLLRDGASGQFEIVPLATMIRIGVYQYGRDVPDPTALEALVTVARALHDMG